MASHHHYSTSASTASDGPTAFAFYLKLAAVWFCALVGWALATTIATRAVNVAVSLRRRRPGFDRLQYGALFFVMTAVAVGALRCTDVLLDVTGAVPSDGPPELQAVWEAMLARWPWALRHVGFAGTVGMAAFVVSSFLFMFLDLSRSSTKVQKEWFPSNKDLVMAAVPQCAIYAVLNGLGWTYGYYPVVLPPRAPRLCLLAGTLS